ncbi:hypothetical protein NEMBOFW57_009029 [Staphylotrichum longicolle]|uniref:DUF7143 domain-containing protein n=1 Tax=Staphylotrichum longicolle TaxID=669026 RepID=A0AAD4EWQ0_9PEZI|nr:hypothetical protein NEMBOFW57_009029 [Staphylotrichum longicolle]
MKLFALLALGTASAIAAPLVSERQANACFVIGNTALPKEVSDTVAAIQSRITCSSSQTTLSNVPDVSSGGVSFSSRVATPTPLRTADLATFPKQLDVYLATEAGIRSVGGNLAIKVPKFFLQFQVDHLLEKVLKNAPREAQALKDQVTALAKYTIEP